MENKSNKQQPQQQNRDQKNGFQQNPSQNQNRDQKSGNKNQGKTHK